LDELRAWTLLTQGALLQAEGRFQEALNCSEFVLSTNPNSAMGWYNKGAVLSNLRRFEEASMCYDHALEFDPHRINTLNNKGNLLLAMGRAGGSALL